MRGLKIRPLVMGILNVTSDSFYDGGRYSSREEAVEHALKLIDAGADIIDVGGESTRPYAEPVPLEEELERVIPVIEAIRSESQEIAISVDTYKAKVAQEAVKAGADMVNDISGLMFDPEMVGVIAGSGAYVVIMHIKGRPSDMQEDPYYGDVVGEIKGFLKRQTAYALEHNISKEKIIIDPGIGFGKRLQDNLKILKMLSSFKELDTPILIGTSMKSFIGEVTGAALEDRLDGTIASISIAIWNGADIVRVHDVKAAKRAVTLVDALMKS